MTPADWQDLLIVITLTLFVTACGVGLAAFIKVFVLWLEELNRGPRWIRYDGEYIGRVRSLSASRYKAPKWDHLIWNGGSLCRYDNNGHCLASKLVGHWDALLLDPYLADAAKWYIKKYKVKVC